MRQIAMLLTVFGLAVSLQAAGLPALDLAKQIDQQIQAKLNAEKVPASPRGDDAEFLRRVYLDITGVIPPADKVAAFLDSKDPDKRAKLIDELLADPNFGRHMADIWSGLMVAATSDNRRLDYSPLHEWLAEKFNANTPWDKFVNELLTATGEARTRTARSPTSSSNHTVDKMTDTVTKLFLGVQLQCAQCHNHPFTAWKQNEYWGMAAFFMKVRFNGNANQAAKKGAVAGGHRGRPRGKRPAACPSRPRSCRPSSSRAKQPKLTAATPYRPGPGQVADRRRRTRSSPGPWSTASGTSSSAAASSTRSTTCTTTTRRRTPSCSTALAEQFAASGFDLKYLIRAICNSEAYQRTSKPLGRQRGRRRCSAQPDGGQGR